ncbi:MAG: PVC-type heme-binding CxxCH protein, partial [Verrucomicrobiota bacterium]
QESGRPLSRFHFGAAPLDPGYRYGDELVSDWAIEQMNAAGEEPLFLAVGLFRPHIPFEVPQKWFDLYPEESIELPPYRADDLDDAHKHERISWHQWVTENDEWKPLMRGYLASISYVDNELGRLLDALDASPMADNTIIVLWTDHGFHIGEKDNWEKFALWDQTTRVPCFIHAPGVSRDGEKTRTPVSLVDLYPTLCQLAGLPIPEQCDGSSLVPILKGPNSEHTRYAISSYQFKDEDTPSHAVVDERYRFIRNGDGFEELYDLEEDPNEFTNRIDDPALAEVKEQLTAQLPVSPAAQVGPARDSPFNLRKGEAQTSAKKTRPKPDEGAIRVLFLGHDGTGPGQAAHNPGAMYPLLAKALGPEAIYFDYATTPEEAFGDPDKLSKFDAVLLYANHKTIARPLWNNLNQFILEGGGFIPVHSASWCFQNIFEYSRIVGGRFRSHGKGVFRPKTIAPEHPAIAGVPALEAWDETYFHNDHNESDRTVLQIRIGPEDDPQPGPEPWTWVRSHGKGRIFYTASGHDERVWSQPEFHALLKSGILWSVGESRRASHENFLSKRAPLRYEPRDNIANYEERPEPLPFQFPLPAEDSLDYLQAPIDWDVSIFAAEPDLVNPIFLSWDERGRLWVGETVDYPNEVRPEGGSDTIKILEDTYGDGRCDKVTVFADGLNIPTSLVHWNGGVIVAQAPDFLFLKDTDGDDRADLRETIMTGWGTRDTHAGPSNLRYGIDNWIYGAVGYSSFNGEVGGEQLRFGSGIYRFRPDGSKMEFLYQFNNNTWGLGFNGAGDVFGSTANRNPAFFGGFPQTGYIDRKPGASARMIADEISFYPITPRIRQVDAFGQYTAGAGYALATSANFPPSWRNRMAFIGGPTGHLLGMFDNTRDGAGFRASKQYNLLASTDEWFSPVAAEVGPDGNLWVADWYNFIIQHNPVPTAERGGYDTVNGPGNAHVNPLRDKQHGRIYRAIWDGAKPSSITSLEGATDEELLAALSHDNQFWRLTAQRILVAGERHDLAPQLKALLANTKGIPAAHALWTLDGLGELDRETHQTALLRGQDPVLKRNAIRAIPNT